MRRDQGRRAASGIEGGGGEREGGIEGFGEKKEVIFRFDLIGRILLGQSKACVEMMKGWEEKPTSFLIFRDDDVDFF